MIGSMFSNSEGRAAPTATHSIPECMEHECIEAVIRGDRFARSARVRGLDTRRQGHFSSKDSLICATGPVQSESRGVF